MTNRPRSHRLEDESFFALGQALPSHWTLERIEHDYGLDVRVEIFSEHGTPTGRVFYVQLKGTDSVSKSGNFSVPISHRHLGYWNKMAAPTLIALWSTSAESLFVAWAHRHHPWPRPLEPKRETFRFSASDRWHGEASRLAAEVAWLERCRGGQVRAPVPVLIRSGKADAQTLGDFRAAWNAHVDRRHAPQTMTERIDQVEIRVSPASAQIALGRTIVSVGSLPDRPPRSVTELVSDAATALGMLLSRSGSPDAGCDLVVAHARDSLLAAASARAMASTDKGGPYVQMVFQRASRFSDALDLAEFWSAAETHAEAGDAMALWLKTVEPRLDQNERSRLDRLLEAHPSNAALRGRSFGVQLAEAVSEVGLTTEAIAQFRVATGHAAADPTLSPSELRQLAGLLAANGDPDGAAECWTTLFATGRGQEADRIELARALAACGNYGVAYMAATSMSAPMLHGPRWTLGVTAYLAIQLSGSTSQVRDPARARDFSLAVERINSDSTVEMFKQAGAADAFSSDTWRLGFLASFGPDAPRPFGSLGVLPIAVLTWDDDEWWTLALAEFERAKHVEAFLRTAQCALVARGAEFPDRLSNGEAHFGRPAAQLAETVRAIGQLQTQGPVWVREDEEVPDAETPTVRIEPAPTSYVPEPRLPAHLPPIESWFTTS